MVVILKMEMASKRHGLRLSLLVFAMASVIPFASCVPVQSPPKEVKPAPAPAQPQVKPSVNPPVIVTFEVSSSRVTAVEAVTLRWEVTGATTVTIDQDIGQVPATGTKKVIPSRGVVYKLTATNTGGSTARTVAVTVYENVNASKIALTDDDLKAAKFYSAQDSEPAIADTISTYTVYFFRRGYSVTGKDEMLDNTVLIYTTVAATEKRYFETKSNAREIISGIATIGDEGYVIKFPGEDKASPATYIIRFRKNNVYVNVGGLADYKELESFAKIVESRIR